MAELFDILTFDTEKVVNQLDIPNAWTPVGSLTTPLRAAGMYKLSFALTWLYSSTSQSAMMRWRQDGGAWNTYSKESKDGTDTQTGYYEFPDTYPEQIHTIEVEMMKESATGTLNLNYLDISLQRVG